MDDLYGDLPESSEASVNVNGIFVEAAQWNRADGGLCDAKIGELYSRLPVIRFIPCLKMNPGDRYEAPLYKTQARSGVLSTTGHSTNFILSILLESSLPADFWILRGTALVSGVADNIS